MSANNIFFVFSFHSSTKCLFWLWGALLFSCSSLAQGQRDINRTEYSIKNADLLYEQSRALVRVDSDSAIQLGRKLMEISTAIDYKIGIAKAKETVARAYMHNKSIAQSIELAKEAFEYAEKVGADSILLETINILGGCNYRLKRIDKTYEYNSMGRRYAQKFGNVEKAFLFTSNAATIMADLQDYEKAVSLFEEAQELLLKQTNDVNYAPFYSEMASAYGNKNDTALAKFYLEKAKKYLSKRNFLTLTIDMLILEGNLYLGQNAIAPAQRIARKADSLVVGLNDIKSVVDLNHLKSKIELKLGNLSAAEDMVLKSLPLTEKASYIHGKESLLALLYEIYAGKGDFKNANDVLQAYFQLKDSINFNDNQNKLKITLAENNFLKEQEILNLKLQKASIIQFYIIIIALLVVLTLLVIVYLIRRNANSLRHVNQTLELQTKSLNEANRTKDKLFSILGHDLKGPIAGVKQLFDLLTAKQMTRQEFDAYVPKMKTKIDHVLFSLNNLLDWGLTQLKGDHTDPKGFNVNVTAMNAAKLLADNLTEKKIELSNKLAENTNVWADENQIEIVIRNLLSNAIKFTPIGGTITLSSFKKEGVWHLSVKDTGAGMPEEIRTQIFDENKQISTYGTQNEPGTGLGLSICMEMVKKNKGEIWVESVVGKGTEICFTLPALAG
jgi:signal transduction histidine kinase